MGLDTTIKGVFTQAKTIFTAISGMKKVVTNINALGPSYPQVLLSPEPSPSTPPPIGSVLDLQLKFSAAVIVTSQKPGDWLDQILPWMGKVSDAVWRIRR